MSQSKYGSEGKFRGVVSVDRNHGGGDGDSSSASRPAPPMALKNRKEPPPPAEYAASNNTVTGKLESTILNNDHGDTAVATAMNPLMGAASEQNHTSHHHANTNTHSLNDFVLGGKVAGRDHELVTLSMDFAESPIDIIQESLVPQLQRDRDFSAACPGATAITGPGGREQQEDIHNNDWTDADSEESYHNYDDGAIRPRFAATPSTSGLPFANVVDEDELRRQILSETLAVDAEKIVMEEPAPPTRSNVSGWRPWIFLILGAAVLLAVVLGFVLTTNNNSGGPTPSNNTTTQVPTPTPTMSFAPSLNPTAAPTTLVWDQLGSDFFPHEDSPYGPSYVINGGAYGSFVTMSKSGTYLIVGYADNQELYFRRDRRRLGAEYYLDSFNIFECNTTACRIIATEQSGGQNHTSISISGDGFRIAMSRTFISGNLTTADVAVVTIGLENVGSPLTSGESFEVSMNYAGDVVATLDPGSGLVNIFGYNESIQDWEPLGISIESNESEYSKAISLSSDGSIVALGSDDENATIFFCETEDLAFSGYRVRVFNYNPSMADWIQFGSDIVGANNESIVSSESLSLSSDGLRLAIGASAREPCGASHATRLDFGHVQVWQWNKDAMQWGLMGDAIRGKQGDAFGWSVALSDNGTTVLIGANEAGTNGIGSGRVSVYHYEDASNAWVQVGDDINGDTGSAFGQSLSLSGNGRIFAAGAPKSSQQGDNAGAASVFRLVGI